VIDIKENQAAGMHRVHRFLVAACFLQSLPSGVKYLTL